MKICYINPTFLIRRPISELIGQLSKDNKIGIFLPKKPFSKHDDSWHNNDNLKKAKIYSYSAINLPIGNFEWPIPVSPYFLIYLFKIFKNYDVIHMWTYFYLNSIFTEFTKLFFKNKKLIMSIDTFPAYSFKSGKVVDFLFRVYKRLFGWFIFSVPDKIHLYGSSLIPISKCLKINQDKIKVLSTGINTKKFEGKSVSIRDSLKVRKEDFLIVFAGLLVPRKGIDIMIKTLKKIIVKKKYVKLILVGDGKNKNNYEKLAKELGVFENIVFTGWRKDIPDIFRSSNLLFLPSRGEGLPGIVMEGMACGLPVVASDIPCIPDLIQNDKNGYLCKMDDINAFSRSILKIMNDSKLIDSMKNNNFKKIKKLDWDNMVPEYEKLYNE